MEKVAWFNEPWTKVRQNGVTTLDDGELLAIIFNTGINGMNSIELANKVLKECNLHKFKDLSLNEAEKITFSRPKSYQVLALGELFSRYERLKDYGYPRFINSPVDVFNIFKAQMKDKKQELFYAIYLDSKNKIISQKLLFMGTLNQVQVHPREVFREAIKLSANSVILVHNHPSGDPTPSEEDKMITEKLKSAGELVGIKVLDHITIGSESFSSIKE